MNLTAGQLTAQYRTARARAGDLIDRTEVEFGIPRRLLFAIGSRETNFDPYWIDHPGDGGHGRGWWQVDDRSHVIPDDWAGNLEWQCRKGAEVLAGCLQREKGDVVRAANRYNSGQGETRYTTGKDYGPDVFDRWQFLVASFPPALVDPTPEPLPPAYDNIHPVFARRLFRMNVACGTWNYSGWRSSQRQKELYEDYLAGRGNPANPPGTSNHEAIPYSTPMALAVDLAGNLDEARRRCAEFGIHFPIAGEEWHAQPVEVASPSYQGVPDFPSDAQPLPDPTEEPEMAISHIIVHPGEQVSIPLVQQGTRFGVSMVSVTLTSGPESASVRAVIGPDWHGLDPDHPEDLVIPPEGRRFEDLGPGSNVLQVTNNTEANQSVGVLVEAK